MESNLIFLKKLLIIINFHKIVFLVFPKTKNSNPDYKNIDPTTNNSNPDYNNTNEKRKKKQRLNTNTNSNHNKQK